MISALLDASYRLPNWLRALSLVGAWLSAVAVRFLIGEPGWGPASVVLFLALSVLALWAHVPAMRFDGPLPFSDLGVHAGGEVHPWSDVVAVEPFGEKDLEAVLADGRRVRLRVKGGRSRDDLREVLARHRPDMIRF